MRCWTCLEMDALKQKMESQAQSSSQPAQKCRAVASKDEDQLRQLIVATAKTVVGLDGQSRRFQGVLESTILIPEGHVYLAPLLAQGKEYEAARKSLRDKGDMEGLKQLVPVHERLWITLVSLVREDETVAKDKKLKVEQYAQEVESLKGKVVTCMCKRCHRQKGWSIDKYRVTLMLTPDLRSVQQEVIDCIATKAGCEVKSGPPARNSNAREVVSTLVALGEFEKQD